MIAHASSAKPLNRDQTLQKPPGETKIPLVVPQQDENTANESADEEIELVEAEKVYAGPLAADGGHKGGEVAEGEVGRERGEEIGDAIDELDLIGLFVGMPDAEEEAFPDVEELRVGEIGGGLFGKPCGEEEEGAIPGGLLA